MCEKVGHYEPMFSYASVMVPRNLLHALATISIILAFITVEAKAEDYYKFPLRISRNNRYFEDQNGRPFLIHGDAAWSLIVQLDLKETEFYLDQRKAQGFDAVLVNLIEHKFAKNPPQNAAGNAPFKKPDDLSTPNEDYFAYADAVINMAANKRIIVFLAPGYLGWNGGDEGWYEVFKKNGRKKLRQYGKYIGHRYKDYANIIWVVGGDYTPSWFNRWTVDELAAGIKEGGASQLMTAQCGAESSTGPFGKRHWLDFNIVYSYAPDLYKHTLRAYQKEPIKPFIMIESVYEGEHNAQPLRIRKQAYWSMLTGAAGHFYGNNPIWNFSSPVKVFQTDLKWKDELKSRGTREMAHLWRLFRNEKWNELVPDSENQILLEGYGEKGTDRYSLAAATKDGALTLVYIGATRENKIRIYCRCISSCIKAFWYDPTSGDKTPITVPVLINSTSKKEFTMPGKNKGGDEDWILVIRGKTKIRL